MKYALKIIRLMTPLMAVACYLATGTAYAQEENYYLEQMRQQSQANSDQPGEVMPEQDTSLLAETDLLELTQTEDDLSDVNGVQPDFDKPTLELFKPEL